MPRRRFIIIAVTIWVLGAIVLGRWAIEDVRRDFRDVVEGRKVLDGEGLWNSLKGIIFPSVLLRDDEE